MQEITQENWTTLIEADGGERLSILMPTVTAGPQTRQNPIRFKNHVAEAERLLGDRGLSDNAIDALLTEARSLSGDRHFWQHQREGLAVFIDDGGTRLRRMMSPMPDLVTLAPRFYVVPLICEFMKDTTLYVLALSAGSVRLFRVARGSIRPIDVKDMPGSLDEAMSGVQTERHLQFHSGTARQSPPGSGGDRPATFHGQGAAGDDDQHMIRLREYCRMVDAGVASTLANEQAPMLLAAAEPILSIYRNISNYPGLVEQAVVGNPESVTPDDLRQQALRAFEPVWDAERLRAAERFLKRSAGPETTDALSDIVIAARDGRVRTLLVKEHASQRGLFLEQDRLVEINIDSPDAEDLLNLAAVQTLRTSGEVYVLPGPEMPTPSDIAAILRYPA